MRKGFFITFEGGDGSGKSTQIRCLNEYLMDQGHETILTREPGGTAVSEAIREVLLDPKYREMTPMTECMMYAAARAQLVQQVIKPALDEGCIVICDRFVDSSIAYQAYGRDLGDAVMQINRFGIGEYMPDLTIYLRVEPQIGKARIQGRSLDRLESEPQSFHEKVFHGYDRLQEDDPERIIAIDAKQPVEVIAAQIRVEVSKRIEGKTL